MIVSPSMSLVAAGVASGICFLVLHNILKGKYGGEKKEENQIPEDENRCACCLKPFFVGRGVRCSDCGARSCRKGCSRWDTEDKAWHCLFCRQQRYWLKRNGKLFEDFHGPIEEKDLHRFFNTAKSRVYVAGVENAAASSDSSLAGEKENANAMETVRDFVEKIVEGLIGNVDDAPIDRLYDHPAYKPNAVPPTMAHTALRQIVERAVEEARKLPGLGASGDTGRPQEGRNIVEQSYEDLLATAILNKVIEKFQKEQVDGNSNVLNGRPVSAGKCALSESEMGLDEGVEEGCSSLEPLSQDDYSSDCSASCSRHVRNQPEPLSLTIEERIEEVTTTYGSDEEPRENDVLAIRNTHRVPFPELGMDIIDPSQESEDSQDEPDTPTPHIGLVSPIESWEENWLFQKKRVQTQADPVAMLVPNPSADFKALIGDKDAEDTSDLSECSSAQSDEEIEKELMEAIINVVPRSPKKNKFENGLDQRLNVSKDVNGKTIFKDEYPTERLTNGHKFEGLDKTDTRALEESSANMETKTENLETNRADIPRGDLKQTVEVNKDVEAKDVERSNAEEKIEEISVSGSMSKVNDESTKVEEEKLHKESKENADDATNDGSRASERIEFAEGNSYNSTAVSPSEENVSLVPKTPSSTPTGTLVTEISLESTNDEDIFTSREEHVLSSLECAKKKLMAVDDDTMETFKREEAMYIQQRADFHAEDIQQESEYTEHYDIAIQRHLDSLTKTDTVEENDTFDTDSEARSEISKDPSESTDSNCREAVAFARAASAEPLSPRDRKSEGEVQLASPPRPGTIAEREHKKWENAPPIENNPYSEENIQRRLWERQYSRRSSDIPGIHTELPKSNGADMNVVLTRPEPDIKRFGRDYYINDSRASSNEKGRRSAASTSSRPGSSLSQRSNSTGTDQEQQVSFQLEKFEEVSLRGSLSRWSYRDPRSSPHFAINPLLRIELDNEPTNEQTTSVIENDLDEPLNTENTKNIENTRLPKAILENGDKEVENESEMEHVVVRERLDQIVGTQDVRKVETSEVWENVSIESKNVAYNPLYEHEESLPLSSERLNPDRDSGMYSIDLNDQEATKKQEDSYKRLWIDDLHSNAKENQILSSNGKRYWNTDGYKYHTFGGIRNMSLKSPVESEEDIAKPEESSTFDPADFANLKFQTFGGIKMNRKVDAKGVPIYRRVKLRSPLKPPRNGKMTTRAFSDSVLRKERTGYQIRDRNNTDDHLNWRCEDSEETDSDDGKEKSVRSRVERRNSWYQSSSDDEWQDEVSENTIMAKFLRDASKRVKKNLNTNSYFVHTSRKKGFDDSSINVKSRLKQRFSDDSESLKLEPPVVPEVVERTFESLRDLRTRRKKRTRKTPEPNKKLGVRSLSDVTIW